jgi:hypothetical protein
LKLIGTFLVALLPMVAGAAEIKSTYGQRIVAPGGWNRVQGHGCSDLDLATPDEWSWQRT